LQVQHFTVEEEQRAQRLVLRAGRDVSLQGEMAEETFHFGRAEQGRMPKSFGVLVEANVLFDPSSA
jgi:hypothetical protein